MPLYISLYTHLVPIRGFTVFAVSRTRRKWSRKNLFAVSLTPFFVIVHMTVRTSKKIKKIIFSWRYCLNYFQLIFQIFRRVTRFPLQFCRIHLLTIILSYYTHVSLKPSHVELVAIIYEQNFSDIFPAKTVHNYYRTRDIMYIIIRIL